MARRGTVILAALFTILSTSAALASPYENLAAALRQQLIINDLRTHCRISPQISDEKIKDTFLASSENHQSLLAAADALKMNNRQRYMQQLAQVQCPQMP